MQSSSCVAKLYKPQENIIRIMIKILGCISKAILYQQASNFTMSKQKRKSNPQVSLLTKTKIKAEWRPLNDVVQEVAVHVISKTQSSEETSKSFSISPAKSRYNIQSSYKLTRFQFACHCKINLDKSLQPSSVFGLQIYLK